MQKLLFSIALAVLAALTFYPVKDADLVWEDKAIPSLAQNSEKPIAYALVDAWRFESGKIYAPMTETARLVLKASSPHQELTPQRLHGLGIGLHAINAVLVFLVLALTVHNLPASFLGGLLFALHPMQVEPVVYASALPHVLGATFALFAIWQYLGYASRYEPMTRKPQRWSLYAATASFVLAVLTSPAFIVTPAIAFLAERLLSRRESLVAARRPRWPLAAWALIAVPVAILAIRVQADKALAVSLPFYAKPLLAGDALSFYLSKVFVPLFVGPDYGRSPTVVLSQWWGYATWIFPTAMLLALLYLRGRNGLWYTAAALIAVVAVLPYLGFVYLDAHNSSTVRDRYMYLALLGPALALGYAVSMAKKSWLPMVAILALVASGWLSRRETRHWQDDGALWSHAVRINPDSPIAHEILGNQYRAAGELERAKEHYEKVLAINATSPDIHYFIANIEAANGNHEKAVGLYEKVLALDPRFAPAYVNLGAAKLSGGDAEAAKSYFRKAVELVPNDREALRSLGMIFARSGAYEEAIPHLTKALAETPAGHKDLATTQSLLGLSLAKTGRPEEAKSHLEAALQLEPENRQAHRTLADVDFAAERYDEALPHYEKAVAGVEGDPEALVNLGTILMMNKSFDRAAQAFDRALKLKPASIEANLQLGVAYFRLRRHNEAAEYFQKTLELEPNSADAHYFLGDIARWQGKTAESLASYYKALKIDQLHADANYRLGNYFMQQEKPQQALRHYQAALRKTPDDSKLKYLARQAERAAKGGSSGQPGDTVM